MHDFMLHPCVTLLDPHAREKIKLVERPTQRSERLIDAPRDRNGVSRPRRESNVSSLRQLFTDQYDECRMRGYKAICSEQTFPAATYRGIERNNTQ